MIFPTNTMGIAVTLTKVRTASTLVRATLPTSFNKKLFPPGLSENNASLEFQGIRIR
jgi:hypothetical protein